MLPVCMDYMVRQLARLADISVRTLHYYDQIGLLKPGRRSAGGYRVYREDAVLPLQQSMFFRELGFSLEEIKEIMSGLGYDVLGALRRHRDLLLTKAERIGELLATVDRTIG
jgi:DNA-binding transcriptional MerR regulator